MASLKKIFYVLKSWHRDIFSYPISSISPEDSLSFNTYWDTKDANPITNLSSWQKKRADIIVSEIGKDKGVSISDIGCGQGKLLNYLNNQIKIINCIGYDSPDIVLNKNTKTKINIEPFDINNNSEFSKIKPADYVLLMEVLEYVSHPERVLQLGYARAGHGVIFSVPNTGFFVHRLRLLFGKFPIQWVKSPQERLRFWTTCDLKWWLKALGYKNYSLLFYEGVPFLNKILPSLFAAGIVVHLKKNERI